MKKVLYLTLVIGLISQFFYYNYLPEVVADHFGSKGHPNGWMTRANYVFFTSFILIFNSVLFLSMGAIFRKVPTSIISFPYKDYWLAPERKEEGIERMTKWTDFFGIVVNLFLFITFYLVFRANCVEPPQLNNPVFLFFLCLFFIILVGWLIALYVFFRPSSD